MNDGEENKGNDSLWLWLRAPCILLFIAIIIGAVSFGLYNNEILKYSRMVRSNQIKIMLGRGLQSETYGKFYARFVPYKEIVLPRSENIRIKFEKIDGNKIENISIVRSRPDGSIYNLTTAREATIADLGNGKAELLLFNALMTLKGEKGEEVRSVLKEISFQYEYASPR